MYQHIKIILVFCSLISASVSVSSDAFVVSGPGWAGGQAMFYTMPVNTFGSNGLTRSQLQAALKDALDEWSDNTAFSFTQVDSSSANISICPSLNLNQVSVDPSQNDNGFTFSNVDCSGAAFSSGTLAIASTFQTANAKIQSSVVFNSDATWDIYDGPLRSSGFDVTRVAIHEVGHSIGLAHSTVTPSIMLPSISDTDALQADDLAGIESLYGVFVSVINIVPVIKLLLLDD